MTTPAYVLDTNVFIEAANRYYAFDLAPGFWGSLVHHSASGQIQSIDRVRQELERGKDELARWIKNNFSHAFASTDETDVFQSYSEIMTWVQAHVRYSDAAKADFANAADGWLVAFGRARDRAVVTHEVPDPNVKKRVPIPNVCQAFNVPFINTFEMLRRLGVRFA